MNEIIINEKKSSNFKLILLGAIMMATCIFVLYNGIKEVDILFILVGMVGTLFFGCAYAFIIWRAIKNKPIAILNSEGIIDYSTASGLGNIRWDNVEGFKLYSYFNSLYLLVDVKSIDKVMNDGSFLRRIGIKLNMKLNYPPILINITGAEKSAQELLEIFNDYHKSVSI